MQKNNEQLNIKKIKYAHNINSGIVPPAPNSNFKKKIYYLNIHYDVHVNCFPKLYLLELLRENTIKILNQLCKLGLDESIGAIRVCHYFQEALGFRIRLYSVSFPSDKIKWIIENRNTEEVAKESSQDKEILEILRKTP